MSIEQQRINYINTTMDIIHDLCDELYEALMDNDTYEVDNVISNIDEVLKDLNQTLKNEI
jgi:mevalonate kinase